MILSTSLILLFCSFTLFINVDGRHNCQEKDDDFFAAQIILFFSPKYTTVIREQIAIYYYNPGFKLGDVITISVRNILRNFITSNYYYPTSMKGIILTKISTEQVRYSEDSMYKQQCIGYTAGWIRNGTTMKSTCLSTHPDWMYEQRNIIRNHKLLSVFIPGTHNSGSYSKTNTQSVIDQFAATQDRTIMEQLISGARYIDLRPAYKKGQILSEYWIAHSSYYMNKLSEVLDDIIKFMENTQEIVIVSFKEFPIGFDTNADHLQFIQYLENKFQNHLLPRSIKLWEITCREIWKLGTRLIISYDNRNYQKSSKMWPRIPQMWGDISPSQGLDALKNYLTIVDSSSQRPRVSMAEFTLTGVAVVSHAIADILGMEHTSLRRLGAIVGHNVTQWYNELFFKNTSIVAVDYLDASGIVEIAIEWNDRRFSTCSDYFFSLMNNNNP